MRVNSSLVVAGGDHRSRLHPGGNPGTHLKSISHKCHPVLVAFVWELTKETIHLPLGCLQGGWRQELRHAPGFACFFFFFTLITGHRRSLRLKLSDTRVYEPQKVRMRERRRLLWRYAFDERTSANPKPQTPTPDQTPSTKNHKIPNFKPQNLNPKPQTPNPKPHTLNHKPQTQNPHLQIPTPQP